jgi:iron(III) transport system substrate-binding protein
MTSRRRRLAAALVAMGALFAGACGDDGANDDSADAPTTSATAEPTTTEKPTGAITVYSGRSETLVKPLFEQFTADTGIAVDYRTGDSGELAGQILTEGKSSRADVFFSQDAGALGAVSKAKLFDPIAKATLDRTPDQYEAKDGSWVGASARVRVIIFNPTLVPSAPDSIDELLAPQWSGKIGYAPTNASWQSFVTSLRVLRGDAGAKTWLEGFAKNKPKAYNGNGPVRDAVNSGEISLGLVNHYYLLEKISKEGADKVVAKNQFLGSDPGGLVNVAGAAVMASSDNKPAAQAFVAYLLSTTSQKYFAEKTFEYPVVEGVAAPAGLPSLKDLQAPVIDLSDLSTLEATQALLVTTGLLTR